VAKSANIATNPPGSPPWPPWPPRAHPKRRGEEANLHPALPHFQQRRVYKIRTFSRPPTFENSIENHQQLTLFQYSKFRDGTGEKWNLLPSVTFADVLEMNHIIQCGRRCICCSIGSAIVAVVAVVAVVVVLGLFRFDSNEASVEIPMECCQNRCEIRRRSAIGIRTPIRSISNQVRAELDFIGLNFLDSMAGIAFK